MRDALLPAELFHGQLSFPAVDRLQRAGTVVDARMQNSGIVSGLVNGNLRFFFQYDYPMIWILICKLVSSGKADDSASDYTDV